MVVVEAARAAAGAVLLAWLPGYAWTRLLLPELKGAERFVLSVALSITLVTLFLYLGSVLVNLDVSPVNAVLGALLLAALAAVPRVARLLRARLAAWLG